MIYKIKLDGKVLYYPGDRQAAVINPELDLQTGYAGELTLKVPPLNPLYGEIHNRKSMVSVYRGNTEIFYGEVRTREKDRFKNQPVKATGALSFLADSILPQQEWHDISPRDLLDAWLQLHNNQVEDRKKIYTGVVTIHDSNDSLYRITDRENTLEAIRDKLVDRLGGYLRLRHENDKLYLDWLTIQEYGKYCEQPIQFGENLMDYSETMTADDVITALIPLGAAIEQETDENASEFERLEKNVDITSVNDGKDYIYSKTAVENFGWVWRTEKWDDVSVPANLLKKATEFLTSNQYESLVISLTAVDLSLFGQDYDSFDIGDRVLCNAIPYGMKKVLPVMEMKIPLQQPDQAQLTLGENLQQSFTDQTSGTFTQIRQETTDAGRVQTEWMKSAIDNLTKQMTGAKGGYKLTEFDENGLWLRDLYMDAPDKNQATNILQINKNGIGGSHNGYTGPYTVGMTLDGTVLGERILAGSIKTEALSTECKNYIETKISDGDSENKKAILKEVTTSIEAMDGKITLSVSSLEQQLERKSGNWYGNYEPTSGNNPASAWTTDDLKSLHVGDIYYDITTGYAYRYTYKTPGLKITFSSDSRTESVNYDYVKIYYNDNGTMKLAGKFGGTDIAGASVFVPTSEFYVYWRTDSSSCNFYGFSIASVTSTSGEGTGTAESLPNYTVTELSKGTYPESPNHGNYGNNINLLWKCSGTTSGSKTASWERIQDQDISVAKAQADAAKNTADAAKDTADTAKDTADTAISRITVAEGSITSEVTRAKAAEESLSSSITQTANSISSKVSKGSVISEINQSSESVTIKASKINFNGLVTANSYFQILTNGSMKATSGTIGGWKIASTYLKAGNITLKSSGVIQIGNVTLSSESNAFKIQSGVKIYCGTSSLSDGTDKFQIYNLQHVTSGGHMVFASDGATVAYLSSSSKRYKDHIADMTLNEAKKILDVPVIWFKYKENYLSPTDWLNGKKLPGFYAEDVYSIFPEAAQLNEEGKPEDWNFRILIPLMLKLIQNLYEEKEKTA